MNARTLVQRAGMVEDPGHYSGYPATKDNLNGDILERIYSGIEQDKGAEAADNYVQMVHALPEATATDFLLALYKLENNDWTWDDKLIGTEKGDYPTTYGSGFGTVAMRGYRMNSVDQTKEIKYRFLKRHGIELELTDEESFIGLF